MKNLLLILLVAFATSTASAQCSAPQVNGGAYKQNKYQVTVSNPDKHYIDVEWIADGNHKMYKCTGVWDDKNDQTIVTITKNVSAGQPYYGIKNGDKLKVYMHCNQPVTYAACHQDTVLSLPSQELTVQFHGN